jgi:hypothetical protein
LVEKLKGPQWKPQPVLETTNNIDTPSRPRRETPHKRRRQLRSPDRANIEDSIRGGRIQKKLRIVSPIKKLSFFPESVALCRNSYDLRKEFGELDETRKEIAWLLPLLSYIIDYAEVNNGYLL